MTIRTLNRRTVLRGAGLGAVAIALPALDAMIEPAAAGQAGAPQRIVLFHFPDGCVLDAWTPTSVGDGFTAPPILAAFAGREQDINVVTGLTNADVTAGIDGNRHGITMPAFATSVAPLADSAGGISFDQVAASALAGQTKFSSLYTTAANHSQEVVFSRISYTGPGAAVPPFTDPRALFDYAFADLEVDPEAADKLALRRGSVLDHVGESISSLQAELGAADRIRLQEHLDAVRELEQSLQAGTALGCTIPDTPGAPGSYDDDLQARVDVMMDLCAMILRCDLTRVLVFSLGSSSCQLFYPFLGLDRKDHDISHWSPTAPTDRDEYVAMSAWKVAQFAKFLDRLIATSEGDATLLDNCGVACASELCDGTLHDDQVLPVLVAGGLGGMEGGRHIVVPCTATPQIVARNPGFAGICGSGTTPLANLWLTMLHAAGVDADTFGNSTGTVPDLWV